MIESGLHNPVAVVGLAFSVVALVLGISTTYLAVRGYLRNGQRPMLFVTAGFVFVLLTPVLLLFAFILPMVDGVTFYAIGAVNQAIGLCLILYGLWTPRSSSLSESA